MINAKFYVKNESIHMTLKGHAESAPYGADLICSAATMLAYTVAQAVQFMYENGKLKKKLPISMVGISHISKGNLMKKRKC